MDQNSLYEAQSSEDQLSSDSVCGQIISRNNYVVSIIKDYFSVQDHSLSIAELSIGDGTLSKALVKSVINIDLTCVDISNSRIKRLDAWVNKEMPEQVDKFRCVKCNFDTEFQSLGSGKYDVVIALDIMEHVFDVFSFIDNCHRILNDNGLLLLRVPNITYVRHRVRLLFGFLPITASWFGSSGSLTAWKEYYGWDGGHLHFFTIPILYQLLGEYGFNIEKCRDPGTRLSSLRNIWPNLLYANPMIVARKNKGARE